MNKLLSLMFLCVTVAVSHGYGQTEDKQFEITSQYTSVLLVSDPKCPIKLMGPKRIIGSQSGAVRIAYDIQNVSDSNVQSFVVERLNWFDNKGATEERTVQKDNLFFPSMICSTLSDSDASNLSNLTEEAADRLGFSKLHNRLWIAMIVEVKLVDGRSYNARSKFECLRSFLDSLQLDISTPEAEAKTAEEKLRSFVTDLMIEYSSDKPASRGATSF